MDENTFVARWYVKSEYEPSAKNSDFNLRRVLFGRRIRSRLFSTESAHCRNSGLVCAYNNQMIFWNMWDEFGLQDAGRRATSDAQFEFHTGLQISL